MTFKQNPRLWTALICQLKVMLSVYVYGGYSSDGLQCGFRNKAVLPRHCVDPTQDFPLLFFFGFFFSFGLIVRTSSKMDRSHRLQFFTNCISVILPKGCIPSGTDYSHMGVSWGDKSCQQTCSNMGSTHPQVLPGANVLIQKFLGLLQFLTGLRISPFSVYFFLRARVFSCN